MSIEQTSKPWANMSKPSNFVAHILYTGTRKKNSISNCWKNEWFVFCDVFSKPPRKTCYKSKSCNFTLITCLSRRFRKNITKDKSLIFSTILNEFFFGACIQKMCYKIEWFTHVCSWFARLLNRHIHEKPLPMFLRNYHYYQWSSTITSGIVLNHDRRTWSRDLNRNRNYD